MKQPNKSALSAVIFSIYFSTIPITSFASEKEGWIPFVQAPSLSYLNTVWFTDVGTVRDDFDECLRVARWEAAKSPTPNTPYGCAFQSNNYLIAKFRNRLASKSVSFLCENFNPELVRYFGWPDDWGQREPKFIKCEKL